ncbi:MAG: CvpA family protein [Gammaproteobacteria bacterium]|nr:CvpA family protein [Gammaproteobacteria bacterium]
MNNFWHSFSWFDFVIIGIALFSIIISFFRGFLREVISLIVWILAFILALKFAPIFSQQLTGLIDGENLRYLLAFGIIFVVVIIVGAVFNLVVKSIVSKVGFGALDKLLGIIFGFARGVFVVAIIIMFIDVSSLSKHSWYTESDLVPQFKPLVVWLDKLLPDKFQHISSWMDSDTTNANPNGS